MSEERKSPVTTILILILFVIGVRTFMPRLFDKSVYRGDGFSVVKPKGWDMQKDKAEITFFSPEKDVYTEAPVAIFSIYSEKQTGALFMDDLFPEILGSIQKQGGKILSTGSEKIDGQPSQWVVARFDKMDIAVVTLYLADDFNRLTKIQFIGKVKKFKAYGKEFDDFKKGIRLKKMF